MSGDYTRVRYSAQSGYIGVLEQQGRVRLDADGNELVESIDRRRRAESIDTIGHGVIPITTQNGFAIQETGGNWTIGAGRAYVDGILVDCWGDGGSQAFQADLGELRSPNPLLFQNQPFYYPSAFPSPPSGAASIVYLDVWEREVTALEDPGLIDPAIEGIDTTNRIQAAWQVKALSPTTASLCSDTPPEWQALIAPSTGVLSTATTPAPSSGSPCTIDPVAGYTGLENQLYRVQITRSGTVDGSTAAQFVWSQENASLGAALLGITPISGNGCQLSVSTVGRDKTLGFNVNDNIEVLDDFVEWSIRETNKGGQFVTVTNVDPEQLTITVTPDISTTFPFASARNPRIRRWDAAPQPTQNGVPIPLGTDGVTVTFGPNPAATLRAGDYWVFYARTATGTIEILNQAPPRGVLHHYMRLALVTPPQPVLDCRQFWPPAFESCCTVVVNVGDDIQKAIDSLPAVGGCVCLKPGVHLITTPIVINNRVAVSLHGECIGAVVQNTAGGSALAIGSSTGSSTTTDITVERITFIATPRIFFLPELSINTYIITITNTERCAVRECHLGSGSSRPCIVGFWISGGDQIEIRKNQVSGSVTGILASSVQNLTVAENGLAGPTSSATTSGPTLSEGVTGIDIVGPAGGIVSVQGNEIEDFSQGVVVQASSTPVSATALPLQLSIERNLVVRQGLTSGWQSDFGWSGFPDTLSTLLLEKAYGIFTDVINASVAGNTINLADAGHGGILVAGSGITVCGNTISSSVAAQPPYGWPILPVGIVAYKPALTGSVDRCRIAENILSGPLKAIAVLAEASDAITFPAIAGNRINNSGAELAAEQIDLTQPMTQLGTLIDSLGSLGNAFGILMVNADRAAVTRNVISTCTAGIAALLVQRDFILAGAWAPAGITLDGNDVDSSTIGILNELDGPVIQNGAMFENQVAIGLYNTSDAVVVGNRCWSTAVVHCLELGGWRNRFEGNRVSGGATGLLAFGCGDASFIRNTVELTAGTGIVAIGCWGESCIEENRMKTCGVTAQSAIELNLVSTVDGWPFGQSVSAGIAVVISSGVITIDGCEVTDTGLAAGSWCGDIIVLGGAHVRVRNCRVVRQFDLAVKSRALLLFPAPDQEDPSLATADASGNHVDVTNNSPSDSDFVAVEIECPATGSDIIFVGNMILQRIGTTENWWIVELTAESLAITGNRILREFRNNDQASLAIRYNIGLSYVGNVVTQGAKIIPSKPTRFDHPTPDTEYNANVPQ